MTCHEVNFDGLVGPTHNYAGLSFGNLASKSNQGGRSFPKAAALQGIEKMRAALNLGLKQAILPPHERPHIKGLRQIGFTGTDRAVLSTAWAQAPALVANMSSASNMWTANAATVSPSADTKDGRVHFTTANLVAMPHRSIESDFTTRCLKRLFANHDHFSVHEALLKNDLFGDEGAANHNRLCGSHSEAGLELFVYGRDGLNRSGHKTRFPGRQTREASEAVARLHGIKQAVFVEQNPTAIDAGAFHNDVVCVVNERVIFFHELAFGDVSAFQETMKRACASLGFKPIFLMAKSSDFPIADAIKSYVFNSQLVTRDDGSMSLIVPSDAQDIDSARAFLEATLAADNPITEVIYRDVRESMKNGGGPACLRLRVAMTEAQMAAAHQGVMMTSSKLDHLAEWVNRHYRDHLDPDDLGDLNLIDEVRSALDELTQILDLGALYDFQAG